MQNRVFIAFTLTAAFLLPTFLRAECFDPGVAAGSVYKDQVIEAMAVLQSTPPARGAKAGDIIVGVAVKGLYFGCKASVAMLVSQTTKKFSLFLPLKGAPVQGFELDVSTASRRILAGRAIQVPWDVVDRSQGVIAACAPSTPNAFEVFLYGALRQEKARRCTQAEIESIVGRPRTMPTKSRP